MPKEYTSPELDTNGTEHHPAFGMITWHRGRATPGVTLFGSDIPHNEYIVVSISTASRKRDLHHDWIHPEKTVIEVEMSLAQFAAFMTSGNTSGVSTTIGWHAGEVPGLKPESRLAQTTKEAREAADHAFAHIKEANDALAEVISRKHTMKELRAAVRNVDLAVSGAGSNVEFAAKSLTEHTEHVVQTAKADIEAYVTAAQARGAEIETGPVLSIEAGEDY